jgi:TolB protein
MVKILFSVLLCSIFSMNNAYPSLPRVGEKPLELTVRKGVFSKIPIAFLGFQTIGSEMDIGSVVENDLRLSGSFSILPNYGMGQKDQEALCKPNLLLWQAYPGAMVVQGNITTNGSTISVELKMYDATLNKLLKTGTIYASTSQWRSLAHLISNAIYYELTGEKGIFDTQIVFVAQSGTPLKPVARIAIIDQDGYNLRFLTSGDEYCDSPRTSLVSPNIAYSFLNKRRYMLRMHNLATEQKTVLPIKGIGISAEFSPNGRDVLLSDSFNGSTTLNVYDMSTGQTRQLNRSYGGIAVSPSYSPDGQSFVVSSDQDLASGTETKRRIGAPKLYIIQNNGTVRLLSKGNGSYLSPSWSPDGKYIAFVKRSKGNYYIGVMNTDGTGERMLASDHMIDYPSWAPNSRMLIFCAQQKRFSPYSLFIVDLTGRSLRKLPVQAKGASYGGKHPSWRAYKAKSNP